MRINGVQMLHLYFTIRLPKYAMETQAQTRRTIASKRQLKGDVKMNMVLHHVLKRISWNTIIFGYHIYALK